MELQKFYVVGVSKRTTNENGQMGHDILELWKDFLGQDILNKIPNKLDSTIYSVYTEYEGDFTQPYTVVLGCKVADLNNIPDGMVGISIPQGEYVRFAAKGNLNKGVVFEAWSKIWDEPLNRAYVADFEVYDEKAQNPEDAEVGIFIGVK
ncbi:MAG: AraC family transcriptional regulator [Chlamydiales bacterium]|nr:AraC family transcriptional regulator [Chlamydiales bacterium]